MDKKVSDITGTLREFEVPAPDVEKMDKEQYHEVDVKEQMAVRDADGGYTPISKDEMNKNKKLKDEYDMDER